MALKPPGVTCYLKSDQGVWGWRCVRHCQPLLHAAGFDAGALKEQDCPDYIIRGVLGCLGVQPHGLNPDRSGVSTTSTAREGSVHPSIRIHAERSEDVGRRGAGASPTSEFNITLISLHSDPYFQRI